MTNPFPKWGPKAARLRETAPYSDAARARIPRSASSPEALQTGDRFLPRTERIFGRYRDRSAIVFTSRNLRRPANTKPSPICARGAFRARRFSCRALSRLRALVVQTDRGRSDAIIGRMLFGSPEKPVRNHMDDRSMIVCAAALQAIARSAGSARP